MLKKAGFRNIRSLKGGWLLWEKLKYPVELKKLVSVELIITSSPESVVVVSDVVSSVVVVVVTVVDVSSVVVVAAGVHAFMIKLIAVLYSRSFASLYNLIYIGYVPVFNTAILQSETRAYLPSI